MGCLFRFGCHAGELRSGLSGWMYGTAEVLELLTFWKRGTAGGSRFSNLASGLIIVYIVCKKILAFLYIK